MTTPGLYGVVVADLLDELLALATSIAAEAATLLVDSLARDRTMIATKSTVTDMVTETDRASEALIVDGVRAARPDDGIVGEEGSDLVGTSGVRWLVDPIDGTTNFLFGFPGFAVSIAAELEGEVVVGVVHDPLHRDVFQAVRGRGATRNGDAIHVSSASDVRLALVGTGFSYEPARRERQARVLVDVLPRVRDIRRMGAASVDLCSVACGRLDGYYERGLGPWDLAAGALVASEAGARVADLDGGPASGAFTLAAAPGVFDPLRTLLNAAGAGSA
ncbi:MAG TPA: inositol monophosphatase family protein [Acidimicrobiales bacterium]|nr:inositol monophosphatase family protein [Acidimicrobiales bacterium]